jgi:hypothetical protein
MRRSLNKRVHPVDDYTLDDTNTMPSLLVIEQLSLLNLSELNASIEPTSDCEIGATRKQPPQTSF